MSDHVQPASASPATRPPQIPAGEPTKAEIYGLAGGALITALVAVIVDSNRPLTVLLLVVALMPWALVAAGQRIPPLVLMVMTSAPAGVIIAVEAAGAAVFFGIFGAAWVASVSSRRLPVIAATCIAAALPIVHELAKEGGADQSGSPYFLLGVGVAVLMGLRSHRQRQLLAQLEWSSARLREAAAADERRRIARDIHDVLAHSLTVVVLNLTGARKALATHPELADEALRRAEQTGRDSLDGMRRIVGLLRSDDDLDAADRAVAPTAADVHSIVATQRAAGADVTLDIDGDLDTVGPLPGSTLARVVQEALTNAGRHAPGARVGVTIGIAESSVRVEVRNDAGGSPSLDRDLDRLGLGLVGMRERVEALGGTFHAGPSDGGWLVACELPLTSSSSSSSPASASSPPSPSSSPAPPAPSSSPSAESPTSAGGAR